MKKSTSSFIIALLLLFIITTLLCTPGTKFPKIGWENKIMLDKWVHIFLFMMLVFTWCRFYLFRDLRSLRLKKYFLMVMILCIIYGVVMEIIQEYLIPLRSFEIADIVSDAIGAAVGYFISVKKYLKH